MAPLTDVAQWARGSGLEIILLVTGAVLLARATRWGSDRLSRRIERRAERTGALVSSEKAKHRRALTAVLTWTVIVGIYVAAALQVLVRLGIPTAQLALPAAVVGAALGFGAQRIVRDVLAGFFIVVERQYGFGDLVRFQIEGGAGQTVTGTVMNVNLRITELRTPDGEVVITPNGQIIQVTNLSRDWARSVVDVPVSASANLNEVTAILEQVCRDAYADPELTPLLLDEPSVMGVEDIEVDEFTVRLVARTLPGRQFDVGRELRARVTAALGREIIARPPRIDSETPGGRNEGEA